MRQLTLCATLRQLSGNAIYAARHIAAIRPIDGSDPIKIQPKRKPQEHER